ncbi:MAG: site-2 protease family protein [Candidatus Burarchaeum sp.]|nr:site-2 protease family protein [Candidatus Burarchaeum sp.]MDO8340218.1 site-2 protease family protein [Candidatus Burarchaeum sp.]
MDKDEIKDILISVLALSLAFTVARLDGIFGIVRGASLTLADGALLFLVSLFTLGIGFVLHEMAHKYMAIRYGSWAAYRAWPMGLMLALGGSLFGVVFAAPGATYIYTPYMGRRESGIISLVGPLTNVALAFAFLLAAPLILLALPPLVAEMLIAQGIGINLWLALFNMLPIGPLDGKKVLDWSLPIWAVVAGGIFALLFL